MALVLLPIRRDGTLGKAPVALDSHALRICAEARGLYERVGHEPPWVCYLAFDGTAYIGACGFTRPARGGRVEITYTTFPGFEGRGLATEMARALIDLADDNEVIALTAPGTSASASVLRKLGFEIAGRLEHPENGVVWEWALR